MRTWKRKKLNKVWFPLGMAAVFIMLVPYLILGENAIVTYHDQLDGEMIAYILQAKHLFDGGNLPEFMAGVSKTALTLPAPAFVLLFLTGNYFAALVVMQMVGSLCGYIGMYLLAKECTACKGIAMVTGVLYAYLPFLPVYGLSQYGLPLLFWCLLQIRKGKRGKRFFGFVIVYALTSSLVLIGFGVLALVAVFMLWELMRGRKVCALKVGGAGTVMAFVYIAENLALLKQMLFGGEEETSHKAEYLLVQDSFWEQIKQGVLYGGQHSQGLQIYFLLGTLFVLAIVAMFYSGSFFLQRQKPKISPLGKKALQMIGLTLGINILLVIVSALWKSEVGVGLRNQWEALGAFQLDRLLWIAPCFWYLMLSSVLAFLGYWYKEVAGTKRVPVVVSGLVMLVALLMTGIKILDVSNLKPNIQKLRIADYGALSYSDYYANGVMEQVKEFLWETTGKEQKDYRVVSLGMDPAAAYYHGFYCLDGYSNNYSLDYKHRFRNIIKPELDKSEYLTAYYDTWGNRCYLLSSECPGYYTIEKNTFFFNQYEIDTKCLKELGGEYIISAAYIVNAEEQGLVLLREEPFETKESYYRIFLYGVAE